MTKSDLIVRIAKGTGFRQQDVRLVVQMVLDSITDVLATEGRIELRDFGVFDVRTRKAHNARNPKTGEPVFVPEKKVVSFRAGKKMLGQVSGAAVTSKPRPRPRPGPHGGATETNSGLATEGSSGEY